MDLVPFVYHEKQEAGSQLCAQHCLNNLLQSHTYSEMDLADIAASLDSAENATLDMDHQRSKSYNVNDTGFFSLSTLEAALQVWDLTLVRWRGEVMRPFQAHPESQAGFILHLESHWLPLRKFGSSKRWYNLNSFLTQPEWISNTYLALVLQQAEKEGYSVFVVRSNSKAWEVAESSSYMGEQPEDDGVGILPDCEADRVALGLGEPSGRGADFGSNQAAPSAGPSYSSAASRSLPPATAEDQVASSLERSRAELDSFTRSQASLLSSRPAGKRRRRQEDLVGDGDVDVNDDDEESEPEAGPAAISNAGARERAREAEEMRRAIEASLLDRGDTDVDVNVEVDEEDADAEGQAFDFAAASRSYDDEDAELQAALQASLGAIPAGWEVPEPQVFKRSAERQAAASAAESEPAQSIPTPQPVAVSEDEEEEDVPVEEPSPEELRRRRLERFK